MQGDREHHSCFQCVFCVGYDGQIKIKDEDKKDNNLDLGDYNDQEKDNDYYYPDKEGKTVDSKEKEEDKGLKIEDENCELKQQLIVLISVYYMQ